MKDEELTWAEKLIENGRQEGLEEARVEARAARLLEAKRYVVASSSSEVWSNPRIYDEARA